MSRVGFHIAPTVVSSGGAAAIVCPQMTQTEYDGLKQVASGDANYLLCDHREQRESRGGQADGTDEAGAPTDGSTRSVGDCDGHPSRGGSYGDAVFSAYAGVRVQRDSDCRGDSWGFRVARAD